MNVKYQAEANAAVRGAAKSELGSAAMREAVFETCSGDYAVPGHMSCQSEEFPRPCP